MKTGVAISAKPSVTFGRPRMPRRPPVVPTASRILDMPGRIESSDLRCL